MFLWIRESLTSLNSTCAIHSFRLSRSVLSLLLILLLNVVIPGQAAAQSKLSASSDPQELKDYLARLESKRTSIDPVAFNSSKAQILEWLNRLDEAIKAMSQAIEMGKDNSQLIGIRGRMYNKKFDSTNDGRWLRKAIQDYSTLIDRDYDKAANLSRRANAKNTLHDNSGAYSDAKAALSLNDHDDAAWFVLGNIDLRAGRYRGAIDALSKSLELAPSAPVFVMRAKAFAALKEDKKAAADLKIARSLGWDEESSSGH